MSQREPEVERVERATREAREPLPRENAAKASAITRAIQHIEEVIADLKGALEEMELALELVEEAERQKLDDEREINALQKALERVNRFRGGSRSQDER